MKVLIAGISGLLGSALAFELSKRHEVIGLSSQSTLPDYTVHTCDITDAEATYALITKINPDIVINTIALSNVDECERNPDAAYRVNALGARNIAAACQRFDASMVHVSTDYVFTGESGRSRGFTEFDATYPSSVYAASKLAGEMYVRETLNRYYIVRTAWLFGSKRSNFVLQMAEAFTNNKQVKAVTDMVSSPTNVVDLSKKIEQIMQSPRYGTYHITNTGYASRYEVARYIASLFGVQESLIDKLSLNDLKLPAVRPAFSAMENYVLHLEGIPAMRTWQDAVKEFLIEMKYI